MTPREIREYVAFWQPGHGGGRSARGSTIISDSQGRPILGGGSRRRGVVRPANGYTRKPSKAALKYFAGTAKDNGVTYRRTNWKKIAPVWRRQLVKYLSSEPQGTVVVDTANHFLYVIFENQTALRYGVGVGRDGFRWFGRARIDRKALWPRWVPPPEMRARQPDLPEYVDSGAEQSAGAPGDVSASGWTGPRLPLARYARTVVDRHQRLLRLRPHVLGGYHRPLPALSQGNEGPGAQASGAPVIDEAAPVDAQLPG